MSILRCPACHGSLTEIAGGMRCERCHRVYPVEQNIADFSGGRYYDSFDPAVPLPPEAMRGLQLEVSGTRRRIIDYYEPHLRARGAARVLDCGTGNGVAVDLLNERGFEAWGVDLSTLRKYQWRERARRDRLVVADVASLPFPDGYFDVLIASGLLEHVGVNESRTSRYEIREQPQKQQERRRVVQEFLRVTSPHGTVFLDFPNGAFPIDFWHGDRPGEARWHRTSEAFLPRVDEIKSIVRSIDPALRVRAISPYRRLQFVQAAEHWYGRLLARPANAFFFVMRAPGLRWLAGSRLNPFLVTEVSRS